MHILWRTYCVCIIRLVVEAAGLSWGSSALRFFSSDPYSRPTSQVCTPTGSLLYEIWECTGWYRHLRVVCRFSVYCSLESSRTDTQADLLCRASPIKYIFLNAPLPLNSLPPPPESTISIIFIYFEPLNIICWLRTESVQSIRLFDELLTVWWPRDYWSIWILQIIIVGWALCKDWKFYRFLLYTS